MKAKGRDFDIGGNVWSLHEIAGSQKQEKWESTIDLCRSIHINAISNLIVPGFSRKHERLNEVQLWQGRPAITLMRFKDQPETKDRLLNKFGSALHRILLGPINKYNQLKLPKDLRKFDDYTFHVKRSLLLWTWLKKQRSEEDAWKDASTKTILLEHQGIAEFLEYHNMRLTRACATADSPPSERTLKNAYEILATADSSITYSSQSSEAITALSYFISDIGTRGLIQPSKEKAQWHLDEQRYEVEKTRTRVDRWVAIVFGFVGTTGFADLVI